MATGIETFIKLGLVGVAGWAVYEMFFAAPSSGVPAPAGTTPTTPQTTGTTIVGSNSVLNTTGATSTVGMPLAGGSTSTSNTTSAANTTASVQGLLVNQLNKSGVPSSSMFSMDQWNYYVILGGGNIYAWEQYQAANPSLVGKDRGTKFSMSQFLAFYTNTVASGTAIHMKGLGLMVQNQWGLGAVANSRRFYGSGNPTVSNWFAARTSGNPIEQTQRRELQLAGAYRL